MNLDDLLRILHRHGYWIAAWYPLSSGDFECRITDGAGGEWAVHQHARSALVDAMRKAGIVT